MTIYLPAGTTPDVELFAGPGGVSLGHHRVAPERSLVGIEVDKHANATARAAGHFRIEKDVRNVREAFADCGIGGLMASPPCPSFSTAGRGLGRADARVMLGALAALTYGRAALTHKLLAATLDALSGEMLDDRSLLVLEPLLWILRYQPRWVFLEQVSSVQPVWDYYAKILDDMYYSVATGVLHLEQYGLAQTRRRSFLIASRVGDELSLPAPRYARFRSDDDYSRSALPRPRGMQEILPPRGEYVVEHRRGAGMKERHGDRPGRRQDQPCFGITGAKGGGSVRLYITFAESGLSTGLPLDFAAALQGFPPSYPWMGGTTATRRQIGDAVHPGIAAELLERIIR